MTSNGRRILIAVTAIIVLCLSAVVILLLVWYSAMPGWMGMGMQGQRGRGLDFLRRFETNGERIYFTGESESGKPITANVQGMHGMMSGRLACADCHRADGRGGAVTRMMERFEAPDIRYATLTGDDHAAGEEDGHDEHPPYTDETIKRAITEGIDPAGERLDSRMPRWRMDERDLDDLLAFLKTLE